MLSASIEYKLRSIMKRRSAQLWLAWNTKLEKVVGMQSKSAMDLWGVSQPPKFGNRKSESHVQTISLLFHFVPFIFQMMFLMQQMRGWIDGQFQSFNRHLCKQ